MNPPKIIIDSSVFRKDRNFSSANVLLLKDLTTYQFILVCIPRVVYNECLTQNTLEVSDELTKINNQLRKLKKKGLHLPEIEKLEFLNQQILELKEIAEDSTKKNWEKFIADTKAIIFEMNDNQVKSIINNYFSGGPPFKRVKNRNDFPDAFIYESIKLLMEQNGDIIFICTDNELKNQVEINLNIPSFTDLDAFFKSDYYKPIDKAYSDALNLKQDKDKLEDLKGSILDLVEKYIAYDNNLYSLPIFDSKLPSDNNEGTIQGVEKMLKKEIIDGETRFVDDRVYLSCEVTVDALVDYYIFKGDYFIMDDERRVGVSDWNEHYFWAEESFKVSMVINFSILRNNLDFLRLEIENVEVDKIWIVE